MASPTIVTNVNYAHFVHHHHGFKILLVVSLVSIEILLSASRIGADESKPASSTARESKQRISDTTFWWSPWCDSGDKKDVTVRFYLGGRFIGFDEDGFKKVIEKVTKLPSGTSVVWGPDCGKMPSSGGNDAVARDYFPHLWKEFEEVSQKRGIILSSSGYGSNASSADDPPQLPNYLYIEPEVPLQENEALLEWKLPDNKQHSPSDYLDGRVWPIYFVNGQESGRGSSGFLDTLKVIKDLPQKTQLRLRPAEPPGGADFQREFQELVLSKQLKLAIEQKKSLWPDDANRSPACKFEWRNFKSQSTPHKEIVYLLNGKVAGMGNAGFDAILARLRELPAGSIVEYPKLVVHKKVHIAQFDSKDVVPFNKRRKELNELLAKAHLEAERDEVLYWPKPDYDDRVDESQEIQWFLNSLFSFATIVRDGAKPADAQAIITWSQKRDDWQHPTSEGTYFYNKEQIGTGTKGFLAVLKQLESIPDDSTVRIDPVCIRTHGPFRDAIIMRGQRHFETTGEEPFRGLIDLLKDIAQRKKLHVEVIPDEGKPYHHPGG